MANTTAAESQASLRKTLELLKKSNPFAITKSFGFTKVDEPFDPGKPPPEPPCVDAVGDGRKRLILVEVELRRIAPVANIAKIWKWLDKDVEPLAGRKVTVIQAFSSFYQGQGPSFLKENSEFLGRQLETRFKGRVRYIPIPFKYKPYKKRAKVSVTQGGGAMLKAARRLASKIAFRVEHA